jgi:hypothetical protein
MCVFTFANDTNYCLRHGAKKKNKLDSNTVERKRKKTVKTIARTIERLLFEYVLHSIIPADSGF